MTPIESICIVIQDELNAFLEQFNALLQSPVPLLKDITLGISKNQGKHIRPILTILSAKIFGNVNHSTLVAATTIESIHTASLIHDDIIDEAEQRRGKPSINSLWGSQLAVLAGDFLLMKGFQLSIDEKRMDIQKEGTKAVQQLIEGEFLQSEASFNLDITEDRYLEIIDKKTASMLAVCTKLGAETGGANSEQICQMEILGHHLGKIFQMQDDLFDYLPQSQTGKPVGNDLKEKKITLPLLHALDVCTQQEKLSMLQKIKEQSSDLFNQAKLLVDKYDGVEYTKAKMKEFYDKAIDILTKMPQNEANNCLQTLAQYLVTRNN